MSAKLPSEIAAGSAVPSLRKRLKSIYHTIAVQEIPFYRIMKISFLLLLVVMIFSFQSIAAQDPGGSVIRVRKAPFPQPAVCAPEDSLESDSAGAISLSFFDTCSCLSKNKDQLSISYQYGDNAKMKSKTISLKNASVDLNTEAGKPGNSYASSAEAFITFEAGGKIFSGSCINSKFGGLIKNAAGKQIGTWWQN
jgi:hypothetical protein